MSESRDMSGIHDCGGDAAAYLLGALDSAEAEAFRRHLDTCAVCRDEVEALTGVVHALPMAAPQYPAPKRLRRRLMKAIRQEAKAGGRRTSSGWPLATLRIGLASLAAVVAVVVAIELSTTGRGPRVIQARVAGIVGTAELRVSGGHGELVVRHLAAPPQRHVYEVWFKAPDRPPVPASVLFSVGPGGRADVGLPGSLRGISQVMVTPEPAGGSPLPTHSPVIVASLT